jgi:hypothetical protein
MARLDGRSRRSLSGKAANLPNNFSIVIEKPDFGSRLLEFNAIWEEELNVAIENLAKAGRNRAAETLDKTGTPAVGSGGEWGKARMSGQRWGVKFSPYGNSEGRNDTGNMINSLGWDIVSTGKRKKARFGWIDRFEDYFLYQEKGFTPRTMFDPAATAATGMAQFRPRAGMKKVPGAESLQAGLKLVSSLKDSFFSQAWNRSKETWEKAGKRSRPGSYLRARERYSSSSKKSERR